MRIALVSAHFPAEPAEDAVFPASWELARALRRLGHELLVATWTNAETDRRDQVEGIQVVRRSVRQAHSQLLFGGVPSLASFAFAQASALELYRSSVDAVRAFRPDVVECQEFNGLGFYWACAREFPLVIRCYGPAYHLMRCGDLGAFTTMDAELTAVLELYPLGLADGLITICADMAGKLSAATGIPAAEFRIVRAPLSPPPAPPPTVAPAAAAGFPRLFAWGRVDRPKGADLLVEALPHVVSAYPEARLAVGGAHVTEFGSPRPYVETLRERLAELGLLERVEFLGHLPRAEIRRRAVEADLCVFPTRYETAGYCVLEAMSYGACVTAAAVGGIPEYARNGESAWLFPGRDPHALAHAIKSLAADAPLRSRLRQAAPANVLAFCDPARIARETVEVYEQARVRFRASGARPHRTLDPVLAHLAAALRERPLLREPPGRIERWLNRLAGWIPFRRGAGRSP